MDRSKRRAVYAKGLIKFGFFRESRSNSINVCIGGVVVEMELVTADKYAEKTIINGLTSLGAILITGPE